MSPKVEAGGYEERAVRLMREAGLLVHLGCEQRDLGVADFAEELT